MGLIARNLTWAGLVREDGTEEVARGYTRVPVLMSTTQQRGTFEITHQDEIRFPAYQVQADAPVSGVLFASSQTGEALYVADIMVARRPGEGSMPIFMPGEIAIRFNVA